MSKQIEIKDAAGLMQAACVDFGMILGLRDRVGYTIIPNRTDPTIAGNSASGHVVMFHTLPNDGSLFRTLIGSFRIAYAFPENNLASHGNLPLITHLTVGHFFEVPQGFDSVADRIAGSLLICAWNLSDAVMKYSQLLIELVWGDPHEKYLVNAFNLRLIHHFLGDNPPATGYTLYTTGGG